MSLSAKIAEYITFARNLEPGESVIYSYILVPPNLIENDHNFVFFGYKVTIQQHVCFEKLKLYTKKLRICAKVIYSAAPRYNTAAI